MKERILQEATQLFTERGYHGMSMRAVAERCGVTKAALYYHFTGKEALFLAVLENYLEETARSMEQARLSAESAEGQLTAMVAALFAQSPEQRAIIRLSQQEQKNLAKAVRGRFMEQYQRRFIGQFEAVLRLGVERGEFRLMDPALNTWILLGMIYPFLSPANPPGVARRPEEIGSEIVKTFLHGISI